MDKEVVMKRFKNLLLLLALVISMATPAFAVQEIGVFELRAFDTDGNLLWSEDAHNSLANDGQHHMLDVYLRGATGATSFYIGLTDSTSTCSIAKADSLATVVALTEPSTNGYARIAVEHSGTGWTALALDSGDYMATSKTVTFTASGGSFGPVNCAFLTDAASGTTGKHISWAALSTARTLADGETLQITYKVKLQ